MQSLPSPYIFDDLNTEQELHSCQGGRERKLARDNYNDTTIMLSTFM